MDGLRISNKQKSPWCEGRFGRPVPGNVVVGQDSRYWLDSSAIKRDLGWELQIGIEEGIKEMVDWGRKYIDQLRDWPMDYTLRA